MNRYKITDLGEAEIAIRLGFKSWFADVRLCTRDSIWSLLSLFFNRVKLQHPVFGKVKCLCFEGLSDIW